MKKRQEQIAGDNAIQIQTQIENQNNYYIQNNHFYSDSSGINESEQQLERPIQEAIDKTLRLAQKTNLWKGTLGLDDVDVVPLRESYLDARKKVKYLLSKVKKESPYLGIHNITHLDYLWLVSNTIIGANYEITPLEGYVLGMSFLILDASLSFYDLGGEDGIRGTEEWGIIHSVKCDGLLSDEFEKDCYFRVLHAHHVSFVKTILNYRFKTEKGDSFYIIENEEYRINLWEVIGLIASSLQWEIKDIGLKLNAQSAPLNDNNQINEQKIACILRCSDAGMIGNGWIPNGLFDGLLEYNNVSFHSWISQNHLNLVQEFFTDNSKLIITSNRPYKKEEFNIWNVIYDAVACFEEEIKKSNGLLPEKISFPHRSIVGLESKEALSGYIKTVDWKPLDINVHISDARAIIKNLGGCKLYGEKNKTLVVLRELIQNARDAIHARNVVDSSFDISEGRIIIRIKEDCGELWFEVEDNGIGMSIDCIKQQLLDFGSSYWKSSLVMRENSKLLGNRFASIGKYGIGFFSVFMVGSCVEVVTRRHEDGKEAWKIEFPKGLTLSPILSKTEQSTTVSTIVRFKAIDEEIQVRYKIHAWGDQITDLSKALSLLTIGLDVEVCFDNRALSFLLGSWKGDYHYCKNDEKRVTIHPNVQSIDFDKKKWLEGLLIHPQNDIELLSSKLEKIIDGKGKLRGWILPPEWVPQDVDETPFCFTIGGLSSELDVPTIYSGNYGMIGYVDGVEKSISRDKMILDQPLKEGLSIWLKDKYRIWYRKINENEETNRPYYSYGPLVRLCEISEEIILENIKWFYKQYQDDSIKKDYWVRDLLGLAGIHEKLFVGIYEGAGRISQFGEDELINLQRSVNSALDKMSVISHSVNNHTKRRFISILYKVSFIPNNSYEQIIEKYCRMLNSHPFNDGNKRTLGIWVNLMLDQLLKEMVDWRKVNNDELKQLIDKSDDYKQVGEYLKQFLSSTYLDEMCVSVNE